MLTETKGTFQKDDVIKINNDLLIHIIEAEGGVNIRVWSGHSQFSELGTKKDLESATLLKGGKDLGTCDISRNNGQEIIILKKNNREQARNFSRFKKDFSKYVFK